MNDHHNHPTPEILAFVKLEEVFRPSPGLDKGKKPRLVTGYGHTNAPGTAPIVSMGMRKIDEKEAHQILVDDLIYFSQYPRRYCKVELNQWQFWGVTSAIFQLGPTIFRKSEVLHYINSPAVTFHMEKAARAFVITAPNFPKLDTSWDDQLKVSRSYLGLTCRRIREAAFFMHKES